ncbi:MAG TPA: efflux RND transporter periplasmic adaptor subunit [Polyangiaceae bacterium]
MKKTLLVVLTSIAAIVAIVIAVRVHTARAARAKADAAAHERPVPVSVERVVRADVPIYVDGLGTVTPLQTVAVHSQVDGRLQSVSFVEGQRVQKGEEIALVDPRPFEVQEAQATATRAKDYATQINTETTLRRDAALEQEGLVSQQQVDNDRAAVASAKAAVQADEASIRAAALNVEYAHVKSPIDGVTGIRLVDPGNIVHATDATGIVVLTQLDPIAVIFTLPEDDLPRVSAARAQGEPRVEAYSRDGATLLGAGTLTVVDNQINQQTATLKLKAQFPNGDRKLWPNQFVKARILLDTRRGALVVPAVALQRGPSGSFVYIVDAKNHAETRDIAADEISGDRAIVTRGLAEGDRVVTDGQTQLKPGAPVSVQAPPPKAAP